MEAVEKIKAAGEPTKLRRLLHTWISASSVICLMYGSICSLIGMQDPRFINLEFMQHGYEFSPYFLSLWVIGYNILYYHMYTAIDIVEVYFSNNKVLLQLTEYIHKLASYLLFTIIFPMSLYVLIAFWTAYTWYRDSMYPPLMDELLPPWINHCLHTAPVPLSLLYMFTSNRHTPSKQSATSGIVAFLALYWGLFLSIRLYKGKWVYMVIYELSSFQIFLVFSLSFIVPIIFLHLGYHINSTLKGFRSQIVSILVNS